MMYETAKQLKDAGYPQEWVEKYENTSIDEKLKVYCPSLSELIKACGDDVILWKNEIWNAGTKDSLYDVGGCLDGWVSNHQMAETPEEAVARLWLELNKK